MLGSVDIDEMKPWIILGARCSVCQKEAKYFKRSNKGYECIHCFENRVIKYLSDMDISKWTWEYFSSVLSYGTMSQRLAALIHFKKFQTKPELSGILIENLGFISNHPLDRLVRQKAFDALSQFNNSRKIFDELLNIKQYNSWQQKINILVSAYEMNPSDERIPDLIRKMVYDPSPNVRRGVALLIKDNKQIWARTVFERLMADTNPLVREACMTDEQKQSKTIQKKIYSLKKELKHKKAKTKPVLYNALEKHIARVLNIQSKYQKIYKLYLSHLPELMDKKKYKKEQLKVVKQNTEISCVKLIAAAITDRSLLAAFLERLPKPVVFLLYLCVYEMHEMDEALIKEKLRFYSMDSDSSNDRGVHVKDTASFDGASPSDKLYSTDSDFLDSSNPNISYDNLNIIQLDKVIKEDPAFFLFSTKVKYVYGYDYANVIFINKYLRKYIGKNLPKPNFIFIKPVKNLTNRVEHIYEDKHDILHKLPLILNFISQGHLQFNKNGTKILVKSLKKMAKTCGISEYYENENKELNFLKATLIGNFFNCIQPWEMEELKDIAGFMKKRLNFYFSNKDFIEYTYRNAYDHIKNQCSYYNSADDEERVRGNLKKIFKMIPSGKWVFIDKLAQAVFYSGIGLKIFSSRYEYNDLYIMLTSHSEFSNAERVSVRSLFYFDVIFLPLIKHVMFLFGAMGIVDIGYSAPRNRIYKLYGKPWLTVYDGLKYVRMTDLGDYVFGRKKQFKTSIKIKSSKIDIDEHRTILSIYGEDPIKHMILESIGQKINKSSYMINFQSFLKDCNTNEDVKNRIAFFRTNIAKKPPEIWENFFRDVLARINPIQEVYDTMVFRIKPNRELLLLLTTDHILKKYIIKAENYHIIVKYSDFSKIKRRLAVLGFFI